jgi:PKD domain
MFEIGDDLPTLGASPERLSLVRNPDLLDVRGPTRVTAGDTAMFEVLAGSAEEPVLGGHWNFGDGTSADGIKVQHAYTTSGTYEVAVTATGLGSLTSSKTQKVVVDGAISTRFEPSRNKRAGDAEGR